MNTRRKLIVALGAGALGAPMACFAQRQAERIKRIGWIDPGTPVSSAIRIKALQQGMHELGHVEGKNVVYDFRLAEGKIDRFPELAAELVSLKPDCIFAVGVDAIRALKQSTNSIPIVMGTIDVDPVKEGLVASMARPGGNITGLTGIGWELAGKRLELLRGIKPKLSRVAFLFDPRSEASFAHLNETKVAAAKLGVKLQLIEVRNPEGLKDAFRIARERRAEAIFILGIGVLIGYRVQIVDLATKARLPAMYSASDFVRDGGLVSYASDVPEQFRRAAIYVDKILKGAKPGELPIEQPTKFQLVVNLKAAKKIGLTIPPNVLARADEVIE